jgi:MYXO-CTERM domain-containing protein
VNKFRKTALAAAIMAVGMSSAYAATTTGNNFTMLSSSGGMVGTDPFVTFGWDGTYNTPGNAVVNATLAPGDTMTFFGYVWTAHDVKILAPGTHTVGGYTLTVGAGQVGMHMLFDWGTTADISVVEVCAPGTFNGGATTWECASVDGNGGGGLDGIPGIPMAGGPFEFFNANFSVNGASAYVAPTMPPTVYPLSGGVGVPTSDSVTVTFDHAVKVATVTGTSFTLVKTAGSVAVTGVVSCSGTTTATSCTFNPTGNLDNTTQYTATLTTAIQDAAGVALSSGYAWNFTTAAGADVTPPTISSYSPTGASATDAAISASFSVTFDEIMDVASVTTAFTVKDASNAPVAGVVSTGDSRTFTFTPSAVLSNSASYTATVSIAATDTAGNALLTPQSWSLTTAAPPPAPLLAVSGAAGGGCVTDPTGRDVSLLAALLAGLGYAGWRRRSS